MDKVELLSPAGDFETALYAFDAGADAVYCGLKERSARAFAGNFSFEELSRLVAVARSRGKKVHVAYNTLVEESEMRSAAEDLARLEEISPDALIVQDLGVAAMCREHFPSLRLHASTQLAAHNLEGVVALGELGFERVVLARETTAADVAAIAKRCGGVELECFIHGALCYSVSGLCLFSAIENSRSGNRGCCAYSCRSCFAGENGGATYPFSMKDLRLGEDALKLVDAGAASLKIEGRMKSPLYVAAVTRRYRDILDGKKPSISDGDIETIFSRKTTKLYLDGRGAGESVVDPVSVGHAGAKTGVVKRVTKDRDGREWIRFHTLRPLERHDGLQFASPDGGRPCGFGITSMRRAISRAEVFEVAAGDDIEVLLPGGVQYAGLKRAVVPGAEVFHSMSNAVKRRFPSPQYRPCDYPGAVALDLSLSVSANRLLLAASACGARAECVSEGVFAPASDADRNARTASDALSRLGGTPYFLAGLEISNPDNLFVPRGMLNALRRDTLEKLEEARASRRARMAEEALRAETPSTTDAGESPAKVVKTVLSRFTGTEDADETVVLVTPDDDVSSLSGAKVRLALPVWTDESAFRDLRMFVKRALRLGFSKWEVSSLAALRLLRTLGVDDITADWPVYAFNSHALAVLSRLGVRRFVASPENSRANAEFLAKSGYAVDFLSRQSTPLFISVNESAPADLGGYAVFKRGGIYATVRRQPRKFDVPPGCIERIDRSWDV